MSQIRGFRENPYILLKVRKCDDRKCSHLHVGTNTKSVHPLCSSRQPLPKEGSSNIFK